MFRVISGVQVLYSNAATSAINPRPGPRSQNSFIVGGRPLSMSTGALFRIESFLIRFPLTSGGMGPRLAGAGFSTDENPALVLSREQVFASVGLAV